MRLPLTQNLSMQKAFWACLLAMLLVNSQAQVSIFIENQNHTNFQLVANGYLQNVTSAKAIVFSGYSANVVYDLVFLTDSEKTQQFNRKLNLPQAGIYHYIIMQNFKGQYQLRFRGKLSELPPNLTNIRYEEKVAFAPVLARIKEEKQTLALADKKVVKADDPINTAVNTLAVNEKENAEKKPLKKKTLADALEEFQELAFEFDKLLFAKNYLLKFNLTAEAAAEILTSFKYDQTRLQFLEALLAEHANLSASKTQLIQTFTYELSKRQALTLFKK